MKTDAELDAIAQAIRDSCQLTDPDYPQTRRKLLRSIQIDALREAREMVAANPFQHEWTGATIQSDALPGLDKLIRDLELR